jgi:hypothetical protein
MGGFVSGFGAGASDKDNTFQKLADKIKSKHRSKAGVSAGDTAGGSDDPGAPGMKKGGPIKKTRTYKLHAGEYVLNKKQAKRMKGK